MPETTPTDTPLALATREDREWLARMTYRGMPDGLVATVTRILASLDALEVLATFARIERGDEWLARSDAERTPQPARLSGDHTGGD